MDSSNTSLIILWDSVTNSLDKYISILIFIFGCIGNLLNILILSQRTLRSNPCALFFNASSISGLLVLISGIATRLMAGWSNDPTDTIGWFCKIRSFLVYSGRTGFLWYVLLATIDRWLSSSMHANRRKMSSLKNTHRSLIIIILFSFFLNVFLLYCYDANQIGGPSKCYGQTAICRLAIDLTYFLIIISLPLGLMIIFGLLIVLNVRQKQVLVRNIAGINIINARTQTTENSGGQLRRKKEDRQLLLMLLGQVIILFLLTSPHAIQKLYTSFDYNPFKSDLQQAIDRFFYSFVTTLTFLANGMPFYIYTLTGGKIFRNAFLNLIKMIRRKIIRRH